MEYLFFDTKKSRINRSLQFPKTPSEYSTEFPVIGDWKLHVFQWYICL